MSNKKLNPKKIPRTEADCKREYKRGYEKGMDDGMKHLMEMIIFNLLDKHNATKDEIHTLTSEVNYLADSIRRGDIKWKDIWAVLNDEFEVKVKLEN